MGSMIIKDYVITKNSKGIEFAINSIQQMLDNVKDLEEITFLFDANRKNPTFVSFAITDQAWKEFVSKAVNKHETFVVRSEAINKDISEAINFLIDFYVVENYTITFKGTKKYYIDKEYPKPFGEMEICHTVNLKAKSKKHAKMLAEKLKSEWSCATIVSIEKIKED